MKQKIEDLLTIVQKLENNGIPYSLGGSGLLYSLGLIDIVNDWDITTSVAKKDLLHALDPLNVKESSSGKFPFASEYKLLIRYNTSEMEIIGNFSIYSDNGICRIPSIPTFDWKGVKVGSPEAWYVAYKLMRKTEKAESLLYFLRLNGAKIEIVEKLLKEPLPKETQYSLLSLPPLREANQTFD